MAFVTLTPAYGRDFKNQKEVKAAWNENKDFVIADMFHPDSGRYINKQDAQKGDTYNIRYAKNTKVLPIKG